MTIRTICCSVLFYNKSVFPDHWQNTPLSTLFKTSAYLLTWAWFYLSSKWFLSKNRPSFRFYTVCFVVLLGFDTIASAASLLTLGLAFPIICLGYYNLILCHPDIDQVRYPANIYAICLSRGQNLPRLQSWLVLPMAQDANTICSCGCRCPLRNILRDSRLCRISCSSRTHSVHSIYPLCFSVLGKSPMTNSSPT